MVIAKLVINMHTPRIHKISRSNLLISFLNNNVSALIIEYDHATESDKDMDTVKIYKIINIHLCLVDTLYVLSLNVRYNLDINAVVESESNK